MSEWISVEDRLPDENQAVIVFGQPYANMGDCLAVAVIDDDEWYEADTAFGWLEINEFTDQGFNDLDGITHWMPLPEPPQ